MAGQRRSTRQRKSGGALDAGRAAEPPAASDSTPFLDVLPDELLLKVFAQLATVHSASPDDETGLPEPYTDLDCFSIVSLPPHAGLRQFPFLSQVCKRWRNLLNHPTSQAELWREVVIDFGQELVTSVHRPLKWSNERPSDEEFKAEFARTTISTQRIMSFVSERQHIVRRLVLLNAEGYWSDENEFVPLRHKHNFSASCFGALLGMLHRNLEELRVQQCNNLFLAGSEAVDAITCCAGSLRRLHLLDLQCHVSREALVRLGALTQLEELTVGTGGGTPNDWVAVGPPVGIVALPEAWAALQRLRCLALRGHNMLRSLPEWLAKLQLRSLEVSMCRNVVDLHIVDRLTSLDTLVLQGMSLIQDRSSNSQLYAGWLPDIARLTGLTSLCLADNCLSRIPPSYAALQRLVSLDLSGNSYLKVPAPLTVLYNMPALRLVDLRAIHQEQETCWSEDKCVSMSHVAALAKVFKRRKPPGTVKVCHH